MKSKTKHILQKLLVNDFAYRLSRPFLFIAKRIEASRANYLNEPSNKVLKASAEKIFVKKIVCNGPFKGLKFDMEATSTGSTYAMLLGSFESEIHPYIDDAKNKNYEMVVNIGCADGYYAVGLAKMLPLVRVFAYDTDRQALLAAQRVAQQNEVHKRITFLGTFTATTLNEIDDEKRALFIVDCEGAEREIFRRENVHRLVHADLIIEMHINIYPELADYFTALFESTHHITIVDSVDDHIKARSYLFPEIAGLDYQLRRFITEERAIFMQWIVLSAKNPN